MPGFETWYSTSVRLASLVLAVGLSGSWAPLQCASEPDPSLRKYETPEEALYDLAGRFRRTGDEKAWKETLSYLVERYPNSRYAVRARQDLGAEPGRE